MANKQKRTVNLAKIVKGLHLDRTAAYRRFYRLLDFFKLDRLELKDEDGEFWFHPEEAAFVQELLVQVEEPYLRDLLKERALNGESFTECWKKSMEFRQTMHKLAARVEDKQVREWCFNVTEALGQRRSLQWLREHTDSLKKEISDLGPTLETQLEIVQQLEGHLTAWKTELLKRNQGLN